MSARVSLARVRARRFFAARSSELAAATPAAADKARELFGEPIAGLRPTSSPPWSGTPLPAWW